MNTYQGSCHCGAVQYQVETDLKQVIACNCSNCSRNGYLLNFVPVSAFNLKQGEEMLNDYQFNKKIIHHLFCRTCGAHSFCRGKGPDGSEMIAINVRCLTDVDPTTLTITPFDGKSK
jgi:hypothetical protein